MIDFRKIANEWFSALDNYEAGRPIEEVARELGFDRPDRIIKLASNENPLGPSPLALKALRRHLRQIHRYPDGNASALRRALAARLNVSENQILPTNGSNEAIELLAHVFLGPDNNVVVSDCSFVVYRLVAEVCRARVISVPMVNYTYDLDSMLRAIGPRTKIVFVANPNNPTSTMVDQSAIDRFMARLPAHVIACFDEAYLEILPPSRQPDTLKYVREGRQVVVLRTFSKSYGLAGLRIGYAVAPESCIDLLNRARQPFNVNSAAMVAAIAAMDDVEHLERFRRLVQRGIAYYQRQCRLMGLEYVPACANFIIVDVLGDGSGPYKSGREVFDAMLRKGVIVRTLDCYNLPRHIRITIGTAGENRRCLAALRDVLKSS